MSNNWSIGRQQLRSGGRRRDSVAALRHPLINRSEATAGGFCRQPLPRGEGFGERVTWTKGLIPTPTRKSACEADALKRRRRDSNPRNVAVQQFSRLPPSTTRPHLQYCCSRKDCKDKDKILPAKNYFPFLSSSPRAKNLNWNRIR